MFGLGAPWRSLSGPSVLLGSALFLLSVGGCSDSSSGGGSQGAVAEATISGLVTGGGPLVDAEVAFIEAEAAVTRASLQPIEDLVSVAEVVVPTDAEGRFSALVPPGRYFLHVTPPAADDRHLPGGSLSRSSLEALAGDSLEVAIQVSAKPPDTAEYVGSSRCLECHPERVTVKQTLHFLGFRRLTAQGPETSSLQDLSQFPDADGGLAYYEDGNIQDNTGSGEDGYGHEIPTGNGYDVVLGRDDTGYFQAFRGADGVISERLYAAFTYGGEALHKQQYLTRIGPDGRHSMDPLVGSFHVLPAQFSETRGNPDRGKEVTVPRWVTYHPERWGPPAVERGPAGAVPATDQSFDNQCAGCHFTGMSLTREEAGLFRAAAVVDPGGVLDYDGDGQLEEINVGCERCHGPGSEHAGSEGAEPIVNPAYLAPGRANLVCGQCHARGTGNGAIDGEGQGGNPSRNDPDSGELEFVHAGISATDFFGTVDGSGILPEFGTTGGFFNPVDLTTSTASWKDLTDGHGAVFDHSRSQMQQYVDHTRSRHLQNADEMLACQDCHDPHSRKLSAQVRVEFENNALCLECHAGKGDFKEVTGEMVEALKQGEKQDPAVSAALDEHITYGTFDVVGVAMHLGPDAYRDPAGRDGMGRCVLCHMPKTAISGGWISDEDGFSIEGDISAHTFDVISPEVSRLMADSASDPVPSSCVPCHRGFTLAAWPDYRYRK